VFYENLEAVGLFSAIVKKQLPSAKQLYDAHNVDSVLWSQMAIAQNNSMLNKYAAHALEVEKKLHNMVDGVFCCSEHDKEKLIQLGNGKLKVWMVPNGVDSAAKAFDQNPTKQLNLEILFCGSLDYYPNEEGLLWFYNQVYPLVKKAIPNVTLSLVGTAEITENCQKLLNDPSVKFEGRVADVQLFYNLASVCIAPLLSGSGTRLKILEAMSFGNPVASTTIGAEGLDYIADKHLLIADLPVTFATQIIELLQNRILFDFIRYEARELITETYDWNTIGNQIHYLLNKLLGEVNVN
jgi:glycosyltransferase involved in cell wall biosynthesis